MSSLAFLVTELQSLASETRRKHPDIREAAEKSLAILRASPEQANASLASDGPQSEDLLRPVFMGCATKNAKVVAISLGSLQRLIALKAVPQSAVEHIISTMNDAMTQGVDIQLRILQTLVSLITNFPAIHGDQLGDALLLCFKLQESKIAVVSSTAAATLRQLVMFVVDKMVDEDRQDSSPEMHDVKLPDGTTKSLGPSARDAFAVFEDLCLLANSEKPNFLNLDFLHKTFALELIESVLTNYHDSFRVHPELIQLLRHHLCPLLLKALSERPVFPLTLRCTRVVFLLLKQFSVELETESEVFLMLLIKIITDEDHPQWMRVLAMEIMRGLCSDAELMRNVWDRYEASGSKVFTALITALNRLVTEKPAMLGLGYSLDINGVAGMVANAAVGVVGMMGGGAGLSLQGSAMKLQCIDQLDKADSPPIPESYIYLLGIQCLVSLCEGLASFTGPLYTQIVIQRPRAAGEAVNRAPPALDISTLPPDEAATKHLIIVQNIISGGWPALLAALSFVISTNLSDELFVDVLASYQALVNVSGMLGLTTPRDAFFTSLAKFAVPTRVVSCLNTYQDVPQTPRSTVAENFGLAGPTGPPGLSERNLACLKVLIGSAMFLSGSLAESWYNILEVLQNAEYVLTSKTAITGTPKKNRTVSGASTQSRHPMLTDLDVDTLQNGIQRLFDGSKNLDDGAFKCFVDALCKLSAEMVEMQSSAGVVPDSDSMEDGLSSPSPSIHHRRLSGIHIPKTFNSAIRIQAARVLDDILETVPRNLGSTGDIKEDVQKRVLDVLRQQVMPDAQVMSTSTSVELRKMGLETLHEILQSSGHTLVVGWEMIFEMLSSVCKPLPIARTPSVDSVSALSSTSSPPGRTKPLLIGFGTPSEKSFTALIKIAFQSLTLVCDSVTALSPEHLRLCISTLGQFGRQADTNIALTAAASLLWSVSDAIQGKRKDVEEEPRSEVRDGAIQTLFRTMQLYGGTLSLETWEQCVWEVTFPLLDQLKQQEGEDWNESKILALQSIGGIFHDFLASKILHLGRFGEVWDVFVNHMQDTVLLDSRTISAPALRCLEKAVKASASAPPEVQDRLHGIWERVWVSIDKVGEAVLRRTGLQSPTKKSFAEGGMPKPFTQESLVAFVDVIQCTRSVSRSFTGSEWSIGRITRLMVILKGILTYPSSPDYRPDIDALPPVQLVVMETITGIDLSVSGSPSLIMRDLSEYATLAFLASFDVPQDPHSQTPLKRITYIALSKKTMPLLVDLFVKYRDMAEIYVDGTLESVLSAYSIPVKLKYDCPAASKFGKDPPFGRRPRQIPDERIEGIWRQVIDVFRGGILADCAPAEEFPLDVQEAEENFDLALISSLEIDVVPHFGDSRLPDILVAQLAKILQRGSRLYESEGRGLSRSGSPVGSLRNSQDYVKVDVSVGHGSTDSGLLLPRERFSYWCFDLLFLICSDTTKDQEQSRKRLAALSLPSLLHRCKMTMEAYVADESLRGNLPFPRAREDELLYVLRKLLELRLWYGSLWAALSETPSQHCITQPSLDTTLTPSLLIADAVKRSSVGHLFHFYAVLCEIASIPRKTPSVWTMAGQADLDGAVVQLDARDLSRKCLKEVGREMGVP
ncbi:hypothetical protein BDZ89DRAFT_1036881 [Hymenopellis radicata]|nr:hypothetical protein BDZ89DRAFT_1036881 [Hymenopellis radicata]